MQVPQIPGGVARHRDLILTLGRRVVDTALATGVFTQLWRGVVIRADAAQDLRTRAAAAVLAVGKHAVLSGPTAVALHGHDAARSGSVHVTVPYSRSPRSRPGLVVHQNRFSPADVVMLDGLPVFAHDLALADFLCDGDKWDAFASLDQSLRGLDQVAIDKLKAAIRARLDLRDDPRGVARALMLLELATGKADSPPESWFRLIVVEAGLPVPEPQHEITTIDGVLLYVLDMAWVQHRIALEYDGQVAHEGREAYDAERDQVLRRRGWIIVRARAADLQDPTRVLGELRRAFELRMR
jgi:hypothetical protein